MATNLRFGEFRLDVTSRQLLRGDEPASLNARALDTLIVLVRNSGRVIPKEELINEVWGEVIVDENNLNQQISLLRRALDDDRKERRYIETVPRKGFCFVAEVTEVEEVATEEAPPASWFRSPARLGLLLLLIAAVAVLAAPALRFSATAPRTINKLANLPLTSDPADPSLGHLSSRVVAGLNDTLGIEGQTLRAPKRSLEFEAYEAYLKGRYHWGRRTAADFEKAVTHYRRAIEIEPEYAEAYAGLALALGFSGHEVESRMAARQALTFDPSLADLRAFLALTLLHYDFNPELSRQEFERAVALAPESPTVRHWHAFYYSYTSQHDRAIAEIRRAHLLDPLSLIISTDVGVILLYAGRYEEAIVELEGVLDLDPTYWNAHYYVALAYEHLGRHEEALAEWDYLQADLTPRIPTLVGLDRSDEAARIAAEQQQRVTENPDTRHGRIGLAQAYVALGDFDRAFEWLDRAFEAREGDVMTLAVHPRFIRVRGDPRYAEMLHRLQLDDHGPTSLTSGGVTR